MLEKMQEQIKKGVTMFALHELDDTKQKRCSFVEKA